MKYQPQNDVLDPDVPPPDWAFEEEGDPDAPNDAYVIGAGGEVVKAPDANPSLAGSAGPRPWVKPAALILSIVCVALTAWNMSRVMQGPAAPPPPTQFQLKQALYMGVMRVDTYRREHGVTPDTLKDIGLPGNAYAYQRVDSQHYFLSFQNNGPRVEYDSRDSKEEVFGKPDAIMSMGEPQ